MSSTISMPMRSELLKNATLPPPKPPAAPLPGRFNISRPKSRFTTSAKCLSPSSKQTTMASSAPFCGPNTALAPFSPHNGLSMSHMAVKGTLLIKGCACAKEMETISFSVPPTGTNNSPAALRNSTPRAAAAPQPPSLVALPPSPKITCLAP